MSERGGLTLAGGLWGIAFATLGFAAFLAKADAQGIASVALVGQALIIVAIAADVPDPATTKLELGRRYTTATLGVVAATELIGSAVALGDGEPDVALWLLLGLSFAVLGMVATARRVPSDNVFACQIFFHATFLLPLIAALLAFLFASTRADAGNERGVVEVAMSTAVQVVNVTWIPCLFFALLTVLLYNVVNRARSQRALCWDVFVASQALFVVIVFRWSGMVP